MAVHNARNPGTRNLTTVVLLVMLECALLPFLLVASGLLTLVVPVTGLYIGRFKVALSFAGGEEREFVKDVAEALQRDLGPGAVFYDAWLRGKLAQLNLDRLLQRVYRHQSQLVVAFLSQEYVARPWCQTEWKAIRDLIHAGYANQVVLVPFDNAKVDGVLDTDSYIDAREYADPTKKFLKREVADAILDRLNVLPRVL